MLFSFSIWRRASIVSLFIPFPLFELVYQMGATDLAQRDLALRALLPRRHRVGYHFRTISLPDLARPRPAPGS